MSSRAAIVFRPSTIADLSPVAVDTAHDRAVDLEDVGLEREDVAQVGEARADVVHGQPAAAGAERGQRVGDAGLLRVLLGDLEHDVVVALALLEELLDLLRDERLGRDVDRDERALGQRVGGGEARRA